MLRQGAKNLKRMTTAASLNDVSRLGRTHFLSQLVPLRGRCEMSVSDQREV